MGRATLASRNRRQHYRPHVKGGGPTRSNGPRALPHIGQYTGLIPCAILKLLRLFVQPRGLCMGWPRGWGTRWKECAGALSFRHAGWKGFSARIWGTGWSPSWPRAAATGARFNTKAAPREGQRTEPQRTAYRSRGLIPGRDAAIASGGGARGRLPQPFGVPFIDRPSGLLVAV